MPALQRRQSPADLRKAAENASKEVAAFPMVKCDSQISEEDMDLQTPKQLHIPSITHMPVRYESDEESVSPCPDDYEDARSSFSDVEFDSSLDLDDDELPSIVEAVSMSIKSAKAIVVNIAKFAPMNKGSTAAHKRPQLPHASTVPVKTAIARPVVGRIIGNSPTVITLSKPPSRDNKAPPPVPARSEARVSPPASASSIQRPTFPPRKDSHASRPSISTVASNFEDDRSSIADSSASSAPSSIADDADIAARNQFLAESEEQRKDSLALTHEAELERAISDYMMWRSEGSPKDATHHAQISPTQFFYRNGRRISIERSQTGKKEEKPGAQEGEEDAWRREIENGLATPTPTTYAAYDPFGVEPPTLNKINQNMRTNTAPANDASKQNGPITGLRRGLAMVKRNA